VLVDINAEQPIDVSPWYWCLSRAKESLENRSVHVVMIGIGGNYAYAHFCTAKKDPSITLTNATILSARPQLSSWYEGYLRDMADTELAKNLAKRWREIGLASAVGSISTNGIKFLWFEGRDGEETYSNALFVLEKIWVGVRVPPQE